MAKCEFCKKEHDGTYATGRFCCATCARKYSNTFVSEDGRKRQIAALNDKENRKKAIESTSNIKNSRLISNNKNSKSISKKQYRDDLRPKYNHTLDLGKIGELEISKKFIEHGYKVFTPLVDANGIDIVVLNENGFKTVQVKSSTGSKIREDGICECTSFKVCKSNRHINNGTYTQTQSKYSPDEINYIALYSAYDNESYLFENTDELSMNITVRNIKAKSGQIKKINYAQNCKIDRVLDEINLIHGIYYDENIIDTDFTELE